MQALQAGSFLHFENAATVEALKFTARLLADHSATVIKENLNAPALENLVANLWLKAEYVTRETERRRLQQIFVENFIERFRELKPDLSALPIDSISALLHPPTPPNVQVNEAIPLTSKIDPPSVQPVMEAETKQDEFLGIVKTDEHFGETHEAPDSPATVAATTENQNVQAMPVTVAVTIPTEHQPVATDSQFSESDLTIEKEKETATETAQNIAHPPTAQAIKEVPKPVATPVKPAVQAPAVAKEEPFEFSKCTVSLNLILLPYASGEAKRAAIISAASHNLPPEIEFLEITGGEDLEQIAALVKNKLHHFSQTLPVKYMESLRAKQAKTNKTSQPAPKQPVAQMINEENLSGSLPASKADIPPGEAAAQSVMTAREDEPIAPELSANIPPTTATNNAQPNLF